MKKSKRTKSKSVSPASVPPDQMPPAAMPSVASPNNEEIKLVKSVVVGIGPTGGFHYRLINCEAFEGLGLLAAATWWMCKNLLNTGVKQ